MGDTDAVGSTETNGDILGNTDVVGMVEGAPDVVGALDNVMVGPCDAEGGAVGPDDALDKVDEDGDFVCVAVGFSVGLSV